MMGSVGGKLNGLQTMESQQKKEWDKAFEGETSGHQSNTLVTKQ